MKRFQARRQTKKILYSKVTIVILVLILLFIGKSVFSAYKKYSISREAAVERRENLEELENRKNSLGSKLENLNTDRGVEEELRSRFQVAKPGEKVLIIVEEE